MLGALIGAGAQILGGILGNKSQDKANRMAQENALRQEAVQREFAQSGIQWKVNDAKKAGIHPLYALGANTSSYSPVSAGGGASDFSWLGDAGQNIGRAVQAAQSGQGRTLALATTAAELQNEGLRLDNEFKRAQLASAAALATAPGTGPGIPDLTGVPGISVNALSTAGVPEMDISKKVSPTLSGDARHIEAGASPEVQLLKSRHGYTVAMPQAISEAYENDILGRWQWMARNRVFPDPDLYRSVPKRPGFRVNYSPLTGEYYYSPYPTYGRRWRERNTYRPLG